MEETLGLKNSFAVLDIQEMSIETMLVLDAGGDESQGVAHAVANFYSLLPAALVRDAMSGQPKSGGSDTGGIALVRAIGVAAIFDQASGRIGFIPEKLEAGALHIFKEVILLASKPVFGGVVFKERRTLGTLLR